MRYGIAFGVVAFLLALGIVFSMERIDEGERGVVLRNGAFSRIAEPGLNFVNPIFDSVREISVRSNSRLYPNEPFYSADRQAATITLSVTYKLAVDKVREVYSDYGGEEGVMLRLVDRRVKKELKEVLGQFTAATAIKEREKLGLEVAKAMIEGITGPVVIESVQIEDINFSDAYEQSIEAIMLADSKVIQTEAEKRQKVVENEIIVNAAQAEADSTRKKAQAAAEATRLQGDAEADAIEARGKALRDNPSIIELVKVEKWQGNVPTTMVPGGAVPFIDVNPPKQ